MCELSPVFFHGDTIFYITHNNQPYAPVKPIVENMGISWQGQQAKLAANKERWGIKIILIPSSSGEQETTCLPVRKLPAFFASINPKKVKPELRERIELYQAECDDALWAYWMEGRAERQALPDALSPAQQNALQRMVRAKVESLPPECRPKGLYPQIWSRFNNHFKLGSYKQLPPARFDEAVAYIEQMEIAPALPASAPALPATPLSYAERCAAVSDQMRALRREALDVGHNMAEIFCNPFWKGAVREGQLPPEQREFATAMNYAVHSFWMCLHSNFEVVNLLFTAYVEAEKLLNSAEKS